MDVFFDNLQVTHVRGPMLEETHYYPFGLAMAGISSKAANFGQPENKKKYNGIEFDNDLDLNTYEAFFRELDPQIARWWQIDPKIDNMEAWSPYASNYDNPIRYDDPLGDEPDDGPGDKFKSPDAAAKDFGMTYNSTSIKQGKEIAATIYVVKGGSETYYTYTNPAGSSGGNASSSPGKAPAGTTPVAYTHTHGKYEKTYDNNNFSPADKDYAKNHKENGYVATPNGSLKKYTLKTQKVTTLSTNLPSDPKDPDRKNKIPPTEKAKPKLPEPKLPEPKKPNN